MDTLEILQASLEGRLSVVDETLDLYFTLPDSDFIVAEITRLQVTSEAYGTILADVKRWIVEESVKSGELT